jgi:hypothetical protein
LTKSHPQRTRLAVIFLASVFPSLAPGCGSTDTRVGTEPPDPLEQFLDESARALCESLEGCCGEPEFSVDTCADLLGFAFWGDAKETRPGTYALDAETAQQCLAELRSKTMCFDDLPAACDLAVQSRLPTGEACRSSYECGHYFPFDLDRCQSIGGPGRCFEPGERGEACMGSCREDACHVDPELGDVPKLCSYERGLRCNESASCDSLLPVGSPCEEWWDCGPDATCELGVCNAGGGTTWPAPGEACEPHAEGFCDRPCLGAGRCPGRYGVLCAFGLRQ